MKKSFILHIDSLGILNELTDEQCGQLFRLIYNYHNPDKPKETQTTQLVKLAFYPFKSQFDRDLQTYYNIIERNKSNGVKGGRPKKINPEKPKKPDNDSDNDNDNDNDSDNKNKKENKKENNIEERKLKFASTLEAFKLKYGKDMIDMFFKYWTQPNKSNTKFRQELEATWELSYRLETWAKRDKSSFITKEQPTVKINML